MHKNCLGIQLANGKLKMRRIFGSNRQIHLKLLICLVALVFQLTLPLIHVVHVVDQKASALLEAGYLAIRHERGYATGAIPTATIEQEQSQSRHDPGKCSICSALLNSRKFAFLTSLNAALIPQLVSYLMLDRLINPTWDEIALSQPRSPPSFPS